MHRAKNNFLHFISFRFSEATPVSRCYKKKNSHPEYFHFDFSVTFVSEFFHPIKSTRLHISSFQEKFREIKVMVMSFLNFSAERNFIFFVVVVCIRLIFNFFLSTGSLAEKCVCGENTYRWYVKNIWYFHLIYLF